MKRTVLAAAGAAACLALAIPASVSTTTAVFSDQVTLSSQVSMVEYVPTQVTAVQQGPDAGGVSQVYVQWEGLDEFDDFRVEYSQSPTFAADVAASTVTGATHTTVKGLTPGLWYLRVSPLELSAAGRSLHVKVHVDYPTAITPVRATTACAQDPSANCEPRGAFVAGSTVWSVDYTKGIVTSIPLSGALTGAGNVATTRHATLTTTYGFFPPTLYAIGARDVIADAQYVYFTVDSNLRGLSEDGIYRMSIATKEISRIRAEERPFGLTLNPSDSSKYVYFTGKSTGGGWNEAIKYCNKTFTSCGTLYEGDQWIGNIEISGNYLWAAGDTYVKRIDVTTGASEVIGRWPTGAALRGIHALSETNALVMWGNKSNRHLWLVTTDGKGVHGTRLLHNLNSASFDSTRITNVNSLEVVGNTVLVGASGEDNATVDGIWRFAAPYLPKEPM